MAGKELRRLKRRELLKMLLVQCEETERLQKELEELTEEHEAMSESYERLKGKLDVKDERLNQKDMQITSLKKTIEEMKISKVIELEEAGNIAEAALRLNGIFEMAQQAADQYLMNVRMLGENRAKLPEEEAPESGSDSSEPGWRAGIRRKGTPSPIRPNVPAESVQTKAGGGRDEPGTKGRKIRRAFAAVSGEFHG